MSPKRVPENADLFEFIRVIVSEDLHALAAAKHDLAEFARSGKKDVDEWSDLQDARNYALQKVIDLWATYHQAHPVPHKNDEETRRMFFATIRSLCIREVGADDYFEDEDSEYFKWFGI